MSDPVLYHWWADCAAWPLDDDAGHRIAYSPDQVTCAICRADGTVRGDDDD